MLEQFEKIGSDALAALANVSGAEQLEEFRIKYIGRKGLVTSMLSQIGNFSPEEKPKAGQIANKVKRVTRGFRRSEKNTDRIRIKANPAY